MSGLSIGSTNRRPETYTGSQYHDAPKWTDDPLHSLLSQFMNTIISAGFGPINIPFLSSVTQLAGTSYASLAAVPTVPLPTVFAVDILVGGSPQRWYLVAGTSAGGAGIVLPNDYNPITNQKYWVQLA